MALVTCFAGLFQPITAQHGCDVKIGNNFLDKTSYMAMVMCNVGATCDNFFFARQVSRKAPLNKTTRTFTKMFFKKILHSKN